MDSVNVLGTEYKVLMRSSEDDLILRETEVAGYCDCSVKKIVIRNNEREFDDLEDLDAFRCDVLRHEVVHAFLHESGLDANSEWATNEEIVDWIALQLPKIHKSIKTYYKHKGAD